MCVLTSFSDSGVSMLIKSSRSNPLPPVSRIEGLGQPRKAIRLRNALHTGYSSLIPTFASTIEDLRPLVDQYDVERFLDVYEVRSEDIQDALLGVEGQDVSDSESLGSLRVHHARHETLRRLLLCILLSLPATGHRSDTPRWQVATKAMETLGTMAGSEAQKFITLLSNEDRKLRMVRFIFSLF